MKKLILCCAFLSFIGMTVIAQPTAVTLPATAISGDGATLNGTVNPFSVTGTVTFEYGFNTAYGFTVAGVPPTVSGNNVTPVSAVISGLPSCMLIHYRVHLALGPSGVYGDDMTFTTCPIPYLGTIQGDSIICRGDCFNYTVNSDPNATSYVWSTPPGATITAGNNTNSITVCYSPFATSGVLSVYGQGCCNGPTSIMHIQINPSPTPTISGPVSVCINSTGNAYTTQAGMTDYVWTISAGGSKTTGGGTNDHSVTVTWNTSGAQTISVSYTTPEGCPSTVEVYNVTVNNCPPGNSIPTLSQWGLIIFGLALFGLGTMYIMRRKGIYV